jgi:hypothetical protein
MEAKSPGNGAPGPFQSLPNRKDTMARKHAEPTRTRAQGTRVTNPTSPEERVAALRRIVEEGQYAKVEGVTVDLFSASAIIQVYDALNAENRARYAAYHVGVMAHIAFGALKKADARKAAQ